MVFMEIKKLLKNAPSLASILEKELGKKNIRIEKRLANMPNDNLDKIYTIFYKQKFFGIYLERWVFPDKKMYLQTYQGKMPSNSRRRISLDYPTLGKTDRHRISFP